MFGYCATGSVSDRHAAQQENDNRNHPGKNRAFDKKFGKHRRFRVFTAKFHARRRRMTSE